MPCDEPFDGVRVALKRVGGCERIEHRPLRLFQFRDCEVGKAGLGKDEMLARVLVLCCHLRFGDSGASPSFPHLLAHNCPAAFRSAANVASDITSVEGLLFKGTAP